MMKLPSFKYSNTQLLGCRDECLYIVVYSRERALERGFYLLRAKGEPHQFGSQIRPTQVPIDREGKQLRVIKSSGPSSPLARKFPRAKVSSKPTNRDTKDGASERHFQKVTSGPPFKPTTLSFGDNIDHLSSLSVAPNRRTY